ncbi:MAG: hypothetical protein HY288_00920 [Planctomycetia bacterium]|nr:hypothetical protein [Planctomycetia bacterium]
MDTTDEKRFPRVISIPSLIGWLSVCLLAAAWGRTLDDHWQPIWAKLGAFGLVAAVGLGRLETVRAATNRWNQCRTLQAQLDRRVAKFNEASAAIETISAGVRKLGKYAAEVHKRPKASGRMPRCSQAALLARLPLQVTPIEKHRLELDPNFIEKIDGSLCQISTHTVAFNHAEPFATDLVLLDFQFGPGERLSFVVDVIWSQHNKDGRGFMSSGTLLAVGVPDDHADDPPATPVLESAVPAGAH